MAELLELGSRASLGMNPQTAVMSGFAFKGFRV